MSALPMGNKSVILSGGVSPWQAPLAALFSGLSAAGQPGGLSNFGAGVQQGAQNFQQSQQQQQMMELRRMQIEQAQEETRRANQEREQEQATLDLIRQRLAGAPGSPTPTQPHGNYGAATGGIQTASASPAAAMFSDPQQAALFQDYARIEPRKAFQMLVEKGFAEPEKVEASSGVGKIMEDFKNGLIDEATRDALLKKETYIAPASPGEALWEPYVDPKTGMTGQRNTRTHKVDWDPGQTGGIQVDTNGDGTPDITVGGKGMAPPTATASQFNLRGLLIQQGLEDLGNVNFDNVSSGKMAAAEYLVEKGAVGELAGTSIMNDDEKRLLGAQGAIQEAVISAITGAAYNEQQKRNMRAKYVILPNDSPTRRAEKTKAAAQFLAQTDRNSGNSRIPTESAEGWEDVDGVQIRVKP